ncbi:LysM peptidoglycan-binding domain-containing protein [Neisseriaceae bacterium B1]
MNNKRFLAPAIAAIVLSACATQNPAPVVDGSGTGVNTNTSIYTPSTTTNTTANNPYGAAPFTPSDTTPVVGTNIGTEAYPIVRNNNTVYTPPATNTNNTVYTPSNTYTPAPTYTGNYSPVDTNATYHTVTTGDTVYNISKRYGISQDHLRSWNGLSDNTISKGQRLRVKPQSYTGTGNSNKDYTVPATSTGSTHRVVVGDTVYNISKRYGISQEQLRSLNGLNGNNIQVGQVLRLGSNAIAPYTAPASNSYVAPVVAPVASTPTTTPAPVAAATPATRTFQFSNLTWQSPLPTGKVSEKYNPVNRSMKFSGSQGQAVQAAADGQVIFSGTGPRGYGNLVVVQHTPQYLSAYGNNQTLAVKELQQVKRGDTLGTLGSSGNLLFEVRQDGKPIDPLSFMQL